MRTNTWLWILAIAMLGALAWGLEQVAFTPLETGEIYPPFSSLRSDPLGARALYESLAALPDIQVYRLYKKRQKLEGPRDAMFVLGVDPVAWSGLESKTIAEYERLVEDGGRLVIAFLPVRTPPSLPREQPVETLWHIKLRYRSGDDDYTTRGIRQKTTLFFVPGPDWRALMPSADAARSTRGLSHWTAVEKSFGKGTIVLMADTFPLSNEGLREARDAALIAALAGPATHITFDENHFGVIETGSVTKLMRRYRLQGAVAILVVVAILFLWRSASSLLPPREHGDPAGAPQGAVVGRDSLEGLAALLHRGVPEKQLLDACFAEWSKRSSHGPRASHGFAGSREQNVAASIENEITRNGARAPVDTYRTACRILTEKT